MLYIHVLTDFIWLETCQNIQLIKLHVLLQVDIFWFQFLWPLGIFIAKFTVDYSTSVLHCYFMWYTVHVKYMVNKFWNDLWYCLNKMITLFKCIKNCYSNLGLKPLAYSANSVHCIYECLFDVISFAYNDMSQGKV